jgi:hypothetical protein
VLNIERKKSPTNPPFKLSSKRNYTHRLRD